MTGGAVQERRAAYSNSVSLAAGAQRWRSLGKVRSGASFPPPYQAGPPAGGAGGEGDRTASDLPRARLDGLACCSLLSVESLRYPYDKRENEVSTDRLQRLECSCPFGNDMSAGSGE